MFPTNNTRYSSYFALLGIFTSTTQVLGFKTASSLSVGDIITKSSSNSFIRTNYSRRNIVTSCFPKCSLLHHDSSHHQNNKMKRKDYDSSMRQFTSVLSSASSSSSSESTNVDSDNANNMNKDEIEKIDRIKNEIYEWITKVVIGLNLCPFASKPVMSTSENKFSIHVVTASGSNDELEYESEITQQVVQEMCRLLMSTKGTTSVVVLPDYKVEDFTAFLDFVGFLQDVFLEGEDLQKVYPEYSFVLSSKSPDLDGNKKESEEKSKRDQTFYDDISTVVELLSGNIQLVAFHPEFRFADSDESDIENYTNRSPYPMIHILREADVYYASKNILKGDSEKVWGRNIKLLQKMDETLGYEEAVNYCSVRTQIGKDDETVQEQIKKILKDIGGVKDSS